MSRHDLSVPPLTRPDGSLQLHASTVVVQGLATTIVGPSGSGKSTLALGLIARGAQLLADDITWITARDVKLVAACPPTIRGQIEAHGVGILNAPPAPPSPLSLVIDLGTPETDRLPPHRTTNLLAHDVPLLHTVESDHFINAILHYIHHGRAQ